MKAAFPMGLKNASIGPTTCQENWIFTVLLCLTSSSVHEGRLNISNIWPVHQHTHNRDQPEANEGVFKKARPARPQPLGRAERTEEYVSTAQRRERRWRPFSTLP
jgi:hypothetical protein